MNSACDYAFHWSFQDVDQLIENARQWDLEFRQLERGAFSGALLQFGVAGCHFADARFRRSLHQMGAPPKAMRTIAVPAHDQVRFVWRGMQIDGNSIMVFPENGELASVSGADFHVYTCSFPAEMLAVTQEQLALGVPFQYRSHQEAIRCRPERIAAIRQTLQSLSAIAESELQLGRGIQAGSAADSVRLTRLLSGQLVLAIAEAEQRCPLEMSPKRQSALKAAVSFLHTVGHENISVDEISRAAGVSRRTLEYAFNQRFGISPKEYLKAYRLQQVRRLLRTAHPDEVRIADVANRWGFWHMGQFAADYRLRFEELPSETAQRPIEVGC